MLAPNLTINDTPRRGIDPTRTIVLRRAFRAAAELKLRHLQKLVRVAVLEHDVLGLGPQAILRFTSFLGPDARYQQFAAWVEAEAKAILAGPWVIEWIDKAVRSGGERAIREVQASAEMPAQKLHDLYELAYRELVGSAAALTQWVARAAHDAMRRQLSPSVTYAALAACFDKLRPRLGAFANVTTVQAHNQAKLEVYRTAGIGQVGITPETHQRRPQQQKQQQKLTDAAVVSAAGVLFVTSEGQILLLRRIDNGRYWSVPAGCVEAGEDPCNTAQREAVEEVGSMGADIAPLDRRVVNGVEFSTYWVEVQQKFDPILNYEHDQWGWFWPNELPSPLHPGLVQTFKMLNEKADIFVFDADWDESKHPRGQPGNPGQFGSGGGGSSGSTAAKASKTKAAPPPQLMSVADQVDNTIRLRDHLEMMERTFPGKAPAGFVLKYGVPFIANNKTYEGKRGPMKMCFMNATRDALNNPDHTYVEGYFTVHGLPLEHAWTVDGAGHIYDPTIRPDNKVGGYFGVPFKTSYLSKAMVKNGVYGLLGHASKSSRDLVEGTATDFRQPIDPDKLSPEVLAHQLLVADRVVSSIAPTDKIEGPERQALRQHVEDQLYNQNIEHRTRDKQATIILGLPGAGKSTFTQPLLAGGALEIEGDNVKALLPEFNGGVGAGAVHEEASAIMRKVLARAVANGDNIVWPRIDSPDKIIMDVQALKKAGYTVGLKLINVPTEVAQHSAIKRFINTGRYVSLQAIANYGDLPTQAFNAAKPFADNAEEYKRGLERGFERVA